MGSIKVVVVQSTWLSPVVSYNSFNQVPPCTRMHCEFAWQLFHKIQSKSRLPTGVNRAYGFIWVLCWSRASLGENISPRSQSHLLGRYFQGMRFLFSIQMFWGWFLFWGVFGFLLFLRFGCFALVFGVWGFFGGFFSVILFQSGIISPEWRCMISSCIWKNA